MTLTTPPVPLFTLGGDPAGPGQAGRLGRGEAKADLAFGGLELERAAADREGRHPAHRGQVGGLDGGLRGPAGLLRRRQGADGELVAVDRCSCPCSHCSRRCRTRSRRRTWPRRRPRPAPGPCSRPRRRTRSVATGSLPGRSTAADAAAADPAGDALGAPEAPPLVEQAAMAKAVRRNGGGLDRTADRSCRHGWPPCCASAPVDGTQACEPRIARRAAIVCP